MIIGINGRARSGKDEVTNIIVSTYGFTKLAFADKIKELSMKYFELTYEKAFVKRDANSRQILQGIGLSVREVLGSFEKIVDVGSAQGVSKYPVWVEVIAVGYFGVKEDKLKNKLKYNKTVFEGILNMYTDNVELFTKVADGVPENVWLNFLKENIKDDKVYVVSDLRFKNEKEFISSKGVCVRVERDDNPKINTDNHQSEVELLDDDDWYFLFHNPAKKNWKEMLTQQAGNLVRKLHHDNMLSDSDFSNCKINVFNYDQG